MAKRRFRMRSRTERTTAVVAAVVVAGFFFGVGLSQGWWLGRAVPPAGPSADPASRAVAVDDDAIDAGVRAALDRTATVVRVAASPRMMRERGQVYQWTARTVDIKARGRAIDLVRQLEQHVEPAGAQILATDLSQVPGAIGLNNHEGSKATVDERVMRAILQAVKSKGLIFVDSVTSPKSVGARLATEMQIRTASRAVFLDNQNQEDAIRAQIKRLILLALERKEVVAIGHATRLTPRVLGEMLVEFDRHDIELVPVSALVR